MTEPIDQATKDLIEKESEKIIQQEFGIKPGASLLTPMDYGECLRCISKASTVWAEKLKQLETQSHDQVRIIEHLEEKLKQERNRAIDEALGKIKALMGDKSDIEVRIGLIHSLKILESLKDKSHE